MALPSPPFYDDVSVPQDLSRDAVSGSMKPSRLIRMPSGREQRVKLWSGSKKRWTLPFEQRPLSQADTLIAFWEARDGGQRAFRFRDPSENSVTDQALAPDGSPYVQLVRTYSSGGQTRTKNIFAPVASIVVKKNGGTITPAAVSYTSGVVTLPVILQKSITAISQAASAVVTVGAAHGFAVNDKVYLSGISGMVEANGLVGTVTATAATTITVNIDSTLFTAYTSGGTATKYLTTMDTLTWTGTHDYVARFEAIQQEMVHDDAFIRSWSVPLIEVTQGSGEVETIDPVTLAGLEVYLRSDQVSGNEGDAVAAWADISGNGRDAAQATAGNKPVLRVTTNLSPNGKRLIEFNTTAKEMSGSLPGSPLSTSLGFTWYCFYRINTIGVSALVGQYVMGSTIGNYTEVFARGSAGFGYSSDTNYGFGSNQASNTHVATGTALQTGWQSLVLVQNPPTGVSGQSFLYLNGNQIGGPNPWNSSPNTSYAIGGTSGNGGLLGGMGAMLLFSRAHDAATRNAVVAFFRSFFEL